MRWALLFLLGWLVQVILRVWFAAEQTHPTANPDEVGYLIAARILAGGPDADLSFSTVYRGGYSLLLAPVYWLSHDPETVYRLCLGINALINAAVMPLAFCVGRRLRLSRGWSYSVAHLTALLPAVAFYSEYVLTDAILPVVVLGWLLLLDRWIRGRGAAYGAGASLVAAYAYSTHPRGIILVLVQAGAVLAVLLWRRTLRESAGVAAVLITAAATADLFNRWLGTHMYPQGGNNLGTNVTWRLTHAQGYGWIAAVSTGQLWYQIVATAGIAGLGLTTLAMVAVRRGTPFPERIIALTALVTVAGIAIATSAALPDEHRVGNLAYGRYLACLLPVLFVVGMAVLLQGRPKALAAGAGITFSLTTVLAWTVWEYAGDRLHTDKFVAFDFPEMSLLTGDWRALRVWAATFAALGLFTACLLVVRGKCLIARRTGRPHSDLMGVRTIGALPTVGLLIVVNLASLTTATFKIARPPERAAARSSDLRQLADPHAHPTVAMDLGISWWMRVPLLYQVSWTKVSDFDAATTPPSPQADLVLLRWNPVTDPVTTWPSAPVGYRLADARSAYAAKVGWVVWTRNPASR